MADFDKRLNVSWWVLRIGLGVGPIITGIDKYFNKLTDWGMYLSPMATRLCQSARLLSCTLSELWKLRPG